MSRPRPAIRQLEHPELDQVGIQQVLDALVDPVRRALVHELACQGAEKTCGSFGVDVATSTLSHHFAVLREAGVIRQHYAGTQKMNSLRAEELGRRFPGLLDAVLAACEAEGAAEASVVSGRAPHISGA